jgi:hypothetical protein
MAWIYRPSLAGSSTSIFTKETRRKSTEQDRRERVAAPGRRRRAGGEGGIRTLDGVLAHSRFPGVRLKPLSHLSGRKRASVSGWRPDSSTRFSPEARKDSEGEGIPKGSISSAFGGGERRMGSPGIGGRPLRGFRLLPKFKDPEGTLLPSGLSWGARRVRRLLANLRDPWGILARFAGVEFCQTPSFPLLAEKGAGSSEVPQKPRQRFSSARAASAILGPVRPCFWYRCSAR